MHLRIYLDEQGNRVYTLKNVLENGSYTLNAHPGTCILNVLSLKILQLDSVQMINFLKKELKLKKGLDFCQFNCQRKLCDLNYLITFSKVKLYSV